MASNDTKPKRSSSKLDFTQIVLAIIGVISVTIVGYFGYLQVARPKEIEREIELTKIAVTQTAVFEGTKSASLSLPTPVPPITVNQAAISMSAPISPPIPTVTGESTPTTVVLPPISSFILPFRDSVDDGVNCDVWDCNPLKVETPKRWIVSDGRARPSQGLAFMTIGDSRLNRYAVEFDFVFSSTEKASYFDGAFIAFGFTDTLDGPSFVYLNLFPCPDGGTQSDREVIKCTVETSQLKGGMAIFGQSTPNTPHYLKDTGNKVLLVEQAFKRDAVTPIRLEVNGTKVTVKIGAKVFFEVVELDVDLKIWRNLSGKFGLGADDSRFSFDNLVITRLETK